MTPTRLPAASALLVAAVVAAGPVALLPGAAQAAAPTLAAPAAKSSKPIYYGFLLNQPGGCGPQVRVVKVVGSKLYTVGAYGCDAFADRGRIKGNTVTLVGRTEYCATPGTQFTPSTTTVVGGARNLQYPGETRAIGPTTSLKKMNRWWTRANLVAENPTVEDNRHITKWLAGAARQKWTSYVC